MSKPVILVSGSFKELDGAPVLSCQTTYLDRIAEVGGIPLVAQGVCDAGRADGLLLTGGGDISPAYYHQTPGGKLSFQDDRRDRSDFALLEAFVAAKKPVFGICRGAQALNVFLGGSLHQDIGHLTSHNHLNTPHPVAACMERGGGWGVPERLTVNSYHHQAVDRLGDGLRILYRADDGIIEAIAHESLPLFGTQWHPERIDQLCIFEYFMDLVKGV